MEHYTKKCTGNEARAKMWFAENEKRRTGFLKRLRSVCGSACALALPPSSSSSFPLAVLSLPLSHSHVNQTSTLISLAAASDRVEGSEWERPAEATRSVPHSGTHSERRQGLARDVVHTCAVCLGAAH
jgi:hypothetical protein